MHGARVSTMDSAVLGLVRRGCWLQARCSDFDRRLLSRGVLLEFSACCWLAASIIWGHSYGWFEACVGVIRWHTFRVSLSLTVSTMNPATTQQNQRMKPVLSSASSSSSLSTAPARGQVQGDGYDAPFCPPHTTMCSRMLSDHVWVLVVGPYTFGSFSGA
jgi:hypothetical protein